MTLKNAVAVLLKMIFRVFSFSYSISASLLFILQFYQLATCGQYFFEDYFSSVELLLHVATILACLSFDRFAARTGVKMVSLILCLLSFC